MALLGNSVIASSLASTLRGWPELEVIHLGAATPDALTRLHGAHPDAVILSEPPPSPDLIFQLLQGNPDLLVIGVDVDGDRMVVLSGRQASLRTEDDLLEAIGHPLAKRRTKASPTAGIPATVTGPTKEEQ